MLIARCLPVKHLAPSGGFLHHVLMCTSPAHSPGLRVHHMGAPNAEEVRRRGFRLLLLRLAVLIPLPLLLLLLLLLLL